MLFETGSKINLLSLEHIIKIRKKIDYAFIRYLIIYMEISKEFYIKNYSLFSDTRFCLWDVVKNFSKILNMIQKS